MVRISGVDIIDKYTIEHALTFVYGIGRNNVQGILKKAKIDPTNRVHALSEDQVKAIQNVIDEKYIVEGDLRREIQANVKRLRVIGTYRGKRHAASLPTRGQRTKTNARTGRGNRKTVGAMKKEDRVKMEQSDKQK